MDFIFKKIDGKLRPLEPTLYKDFAKKIENGDKVVISIKKVGVRSALLNNYLWGIIYSAFIPEYFNTKEEAHEFFTNKYLTKHEFCLTMEDVQDLTNELLTKARKIINIEQLDEVIAVDWVASTKKLNNKELLVYIDLIKLFAIDYNIQFAEL